MRGLRLNRQILTNFMPESTVVNNLEFARRGAALQGKIAIAELVRVQEHLLANQGEVNYTLSGKMGAKSEFLLELGVDGQLTLRCQRCLEALEFPLHIDATLKVIVGGSEFELPDDEDEAVDSIPANVAMDVQALIEDEILLSLPISPLHPPGVCQADGATKPVLEEKTNPFGALAALKGKL